MDLQVDHFLAPNSEESLPEFGVVQPFLRLP
jgi:hypothetical protein